MNCAGCKNSIPEHANFCPYCGKLCVTDKKLPLEELLLVFLRADLSGFTGISETMAAEDVMNFLNSLFTQFYEVIVKYKGLLYQVIGDEIVAIFGLSRTAGFTPHLSIMAAEEILEKLRKCSNSFVFKKEPKIKIGIELESASIYNIRGSLREAVIFTNGFAKSLALQKNAGDNAVLVGENLYQATRNFFEYQEFGELIDSSITVRAYVLKLK